MEAPRGSSTARGGRRRPMFRRRQRKGYIPPCLRSDYDVTESDGTRSTSDASIPVYEYCSGRPASPELEEKIKLISNCFAMKAPSGCVYHYDVNVSKIGLVNGDKIKSRSASPDLSFRRGMICTKTNKEVVQKMLTENPAFSGTYGAYDGKQKLLCRRSLDLEAGTRLSWVVTLPQRGTSQSRECFDVFRVIVTPVSKRNSKDCSINLDTIHGFYAGNIGRPTPEAVTALEFILRHGPCLRFTEVGRSFFYPPQEREVRSLDGSLEIWPGYHQHVRLGQRSPLLNLDVSSKVFYNGKSMLDCIADLLATTRDGLRNNRTLTTVEIRKIERFLHKTVFEITHLKGDQKQRRFRKLTDQPANKLECTVMENDKNIKKTIQQIFREKHNLELEFPNLPCICTSEKNIFYPIEVCMFPFGKVDQQKLDDQQTSEVLKFTKRSPTERFQEINTIRDKIIKYEHDPIIKGYEISVDNKYLQLEAKIIHKPDVIYKCNEGEKKITASFGSWNMKGAKYLRGAEINSWVLLNLADYRFCNERALNKFINLLCNTASDLGITMPRPSKIEMVKDRGISVEAALRHAKEINYADLAIVILQDGKNKGMYKEVKKAAETVIDLVTQCIFDTTVVRKCTPHIISNLCHKINAKMGGVNHSLLSSELQPIKKEPIMIIGASVSYPKYFGFSVTAVVASIDRAFSRYAVSVNAQDKARGKNSVEFIVDLENMVVQLMKAFYRNTRQKPRRIVFYREGVCQSQFDNVCSREVTCVQNACRTVQTDGYEPNITYIVVQKRHHVRFMPQDPEDEGGKIRNVPPGTIVDTAVTSQMYVDFFLTSHFTTQGTSRPCHYFVLHNDHPLSTEDIQKLTFHLCHAGARSTTSVSRPVPVIYSHLAASRALRYLEADYDEHHHNSLEEIQTRIKVMEGLADTMYFV